MVRLPPSPLRGYGGPRKPDATVGLETDLQEYAIEPERYELTEAQRYRFELERRDFLRVIGGGLVVVAALPSVFAQESGRGGQARGEASGLAAWLHIDEQGRVTAYTGKTEIGQNIRTSLAQVVADELRLPLGAISMVMADTDLTPYDAGTFGSQSTPRMGRQLARAAATAREMLIDQAAAQWQVDRATLTARDGRIVSSGGKSAAYGELTKGQKLTGAVAAEPAVTPAAQWNAARNARRQGGWPRLRHRPPSVHAGCRAAGTPLRHGPPAERHRGDARLDGRHAGASDGRRLDRARRRARRRRRANRAGGAPGGGRHRSPMDAGGASAILVDDLRSSQENPRRRADAGALCDRQRRRRESRALVRGELSHPVHRARAARAAGRRRRMDRRQAHRLDRHAAAVRRPHRARRGIPDPRDPRPRHRARHRVGIRRQAQRRVRDRGGEAGEGGRTSGQARLDPRRGVLVGLLPPCRRDRHQGLR